MSPLFAIDNPIFSIIITILSVIASSTVIILCCLRGRQKEEDGERGQLTINDGASQGHTSSYGSTSNQDQHRNSGSEASTSGLRGQSDPGLQVDINVHQTKNEEEEGSEARTSGSHRQADSGLQVNINVLQTKREEEREEEEGEEEQDAISTPDSEEQSIPGETTNVDKSNDRSTEEQERWTVDAFSQQAFPKHHSEPLPDLGSRLQKYWYRVVDGEGKVMLQITAKISQICPLLLENKEISVLKELMECLKHPFLLPVYDVKSEGEFVSLLIEYVESGSLRDKIYSAETSLEDWAKKYTERAECMPIPVKETATCGSQVLEALLLLYKQGFKSIGQVQSGNVFKIGNRYVLGGYENTILGYRSSIYSEIQKAGLIDWIDVVMFGLMIYEMATGKSNMNQVPLKESDYESVKDSRVKEVLQYIFSEEVRCVKNQEEAIKKILNHSFFDLDEKTPEKKLFSFELTPEGCHLLRVVSAKQCGQSKEIFTCENLDVLAITRILSQTYTEITSWTQTGWRSGKVVAKARRNNFEQGILSAFEIPYTCPLYVEPAVNHLLQLLKLPHLLITYNVHYFKIDQTHVVILFQKFMEEGSLKDNLHKASPFTSCSEKYRNEGRPLSEDEIANIGSQILNIASSLCYMNGHHQPLKLGFLHSGNVFMDGNNCYLGGLENMLLGCRPRDYVKF